MFVKADTSFTAPVVHWQFYICSCSWLLSFWVIFGVQSKYLHLNIGNVKSFDIYVFAWLALIKNCVIRHPQMRGRIELLLKQNKLSEKHIKDLLQVYVLKDLLSFQCWFLCVEWIDEVRCPTKYQFAIFLLLFLVVIYSF